MKGERIYMEDSRVQKYADMLYRSAIDKVSIAPLTGIDASITIDNAYAIQLYNVERVVGQGEVISGKKIGLTSEGIQKQLGVNEPDYGHLFKGMDRVDGTVPTDEFLQPKIEGEIAFVLKDDLSGGNITVEDVIKATDYVVGAFEVVDSRIKDWEIKLADTISDNASSGCYVLGKKKLFLDQVDLATVTMELYKNGRLAAEGKGAAVLGDPRLSVAWLANRLWNYGVTLKKGEVILSGAFSAAPVAAKGDEFEAKFSDFGSVKAKFV